MKSVAIHLDQSRSDKLAKLSEATKGNMTNVSIAGEFIEFEQPRLSSTSSPRPCSTLQSTRLMHSSPASFTFRVLGTPVPQGSVKAFGSRVVANNEQALGSWRSDVASAAHSRKAC